MNNGNVRSEMKYIIDKEIFNKILNDILPNVKPSEFFEQRIHNVYYDNDHDGVIRKSRDQRDYKEKMRVRAYEASDGFYKNAFMELKKKYKGITYKRRLKVPLDTINQMFKEKKLFPDIEESQATKEMKFFIQKHDCFPKVYISYNRKTYVTTGEEDMRITFDSEIFTRAVNLQLNSNSEDVIHENKDLVIMELKINGSMALWFANILKKYNVCPCPYSKYGKIVLSGVLAIEYDEENDMEKDIYV